jgi:acyl dehydratase
MGYGRYYEEFTVGQEFTHWPGRTITEADCTWFALLTMNQHPLHSDAHYAATHTQHKQRVVMGPLVYSVVIGMTVGDTLYAKSRVLDLRESRQGDRGIVTVETHGLNQRGETVCSYTRKVLVPRKNHATLGEGRLPY